MGPSATLQFYTRAGCELCWEARQTLQAVLEERAARSLSVPAVREVDLDSDPEAERRYLEAIPVLRIGELELRLATSRRAIARFLDEALAQAIA
jgi:glutaredoxin